MITKEKILKAAEKFQRIEKENGQDWNNCLRWILAEVDQLEKEENQDEKVS